MNSVFGKTMENIRNISLITNEEVNEGGRVMKPNFKSGVVFSENLMGCEMGKIRVILSKPIYFRQAKSDLSKIIMHKFHNDYMKLKYGLNLQLCYMDTDSLVYDIKTDDFEARVEMSGYSYMGVNKKVIGLMKNGLGRMILTKYMAL